MLTKNKILYTIVYLILFCNAVAQIPNVTFNYLSITNGLSQNTVFSVLQDKHGFMWFATHDGLNKYDGYNFEIYKADKHNSNSLSGNIVYAIIQSSDGLIWAGTNGGGVSVYNMYINKFTRYTYSDTAAHGLNSNVIRSLFEDKQGDIWIGTDNSGLNLLYRKTNKMISFKASDVTNNLPNNKINFIRQQNDSLIWICTNNGMAIINKSTLQVSNLFLSPPAGIQPEVYNVLFDNGFAWIGTKWGLIKYNLKTKRIQLFTHSESDEYSLSHNTITGLLNENNTYLWVGTSDGLNLMNKFTGTFHPIKHNAGVLGTINHNNISTLYKDNTGILWVGTWDKGINSYDPNTFIFNSIKHNPKIANSIPDNTIRSLY